MLWVYTFWKLECLLLEIILMGRGDSFWTTQSNEDGGAQLFFQPFQIHSSVRVSAVLSRWKGFHQLHWFFSSPSVPYGEGTSCIALLYDVYSYNLR